MAAILRFVNQSIQKFEIILKQILGSQHPPEFYGYALAEVDYHTPKPHNSYKPFDIKDILSDGFLWAVPKHRRTIQKRWNRKFGHKKYHYKMLQLKTNILVCGECGGYREAFHLCPTCYGKVKAETEEMQELIQSELRLTPVDKEVVVLYQNEQVDQNNEFWRGKRIVEMKKERPSWFSRNLLQPSTQAPATTTDVKPTELA